MPKNITRWLSILPHVPKDEACKFYQKYEKVMMAQGLNAIYGNVKIRSQRTSVRLKLTSLFGSKGSYYRYKNGERLMNPHLQQMVRDIVHQFAPAVEVRFDNTFEAYDFTRW